MHLKLLGIGTGIFDLWVDLKIANKTNEISNWTKEVTISP